MIRFATGDDALTRDLPLCPVTKMVRNLSLHAGQEKDPCPVEVSRLLRDCDYDEQLLPVEVIAWAYHAPPITIIRVNGRYARPVQRVGAMHEFSHILLGHPNSLHVSTYSPWAHTRQEREADMGAAIILVPLSAATRLAREGATVRELADRFEVTQYIAWLRLAGTPGFTGRSSDLEGAGRDRAYAPVQYLMPEERWLRG